MRDDDFLTRPRPWLRTAEGACPVTEAQRYWIEHSMLWLVDQFGLEAARGELAIPGADFYPDDFQPTEASIQKLARRVESVMGVEPGRIELELFDSAQQPHAQIRRSSGARATTVGRYSMKDGREYVALDASLAQYPAVLAAIIAHELAHARLTGEGRSRKSMHEELTDLTTVFFGMGVFTANVSVEYVYGQSTDEPRRTPNELPLHSRDQHRKLGYLSEIEYGYALACLCGLRQEPEPWWAKHLHSNVQWWLQKSLAYFKHKAQAPGINGSSMASR